MNAAQSQPCAENGPQPSSPQPPCNLEDRVAAWLDSAIAQEFPEEGWVGRVAKYIADGLKAEGQEARREPAVPWRGGCGATECVNGCDGAPDYCEAALAPTSSEPSAVVYLRDVGGYASDGQHDECWVVCSKGDPGAVEFMPSAEASAPELYEALRAIIEHDGKTGDLTVSLATMARAALAKANPT